MPTLHRNSSFASIRSSLLVVAVSVITMMTATSIAAVGAAELSNDSMARERLMARPWYTKRLSVRGVDLFFTPTTLIVAFVSFLYIYYAIIYTLPKPAQVIASHILLMDHSDKSRLKLEEIKTKIGTDFDKFAKLAAQLSDCPSKSQGGMLGKFKQGSMVPPFDRVVFDEASPVRTTLGPIETQFGWHLIYIQDRFIPEKQK